MLALGVSPLLAFVAFEGILRSIGNADFHGVDYVVPDADLQWSNRPGASSQVVGFDYRFRIRFNSLGLRGGEPRDDARRRVLLLGDSYTLGLGVNDDETFPSRLQELLDADAPGRFEVENGGVAGFGALQACALARRVWDRLQPSIVVWTHCGNDFSDDVNFSSGRWGTLREHLPLRAFLQERSVAWSLVKPGALALLSAVSIRRETLRFEASDEGALVSDLGRRWAQGRDLTCGGIADLDRLCRDHRAQLFVTSVGFRTEPARDGDRVETLSTDARAVRDFCRSTSIPFLPPPSPAAERPTARWTNPSTIGHFSPDGNRWFAASIRDGLKAASAW